MTSLSPWLRAGRRLVLDTASVVRTATPACAARYVAGVALTFPAILRARSLGPADARMAGRTCEFRPFGGRALLPGSLFGSARELYARGVYFALPQFRIRPGDAVVDLGANHGVFTTLAASIARQVVAIEAQSGFCEVIRENLERNRPRASVAVELGLVGGGTGVLSDEAELLGASHYRTRPPHLSMLDVLQRHRMDRVDFMKIDIEGSEFDLLRSAHDWLPRVSKIAMEVHTPFGDPAELVALLARSGFRTALLDNDLRPAPALSTGAGYLFAWR